MTWDEIERRLTGAGLRHWVPAVRTIAERFEGLGAVIEHERDTPRWVLSHAVAAALTAPAPERRERLLQNALVHLPLWHWRMSGAAQSWDPTAESAARFVARVGHERVRCWEEPAPHPDPGAVRVWLGQQVGA